MNGFVLVDMTSGTSLLSMMMTRAFGLDGLIAGAMDDKTAASSLAALAFSLTLNSLAVIPTAATGVVVAATSGPLTMPTEEGSILPDSDDACHRGSSSSCEGSSGGALPSAMDAVMTLRREHNRSPNGTPTATAASTSRRKRSNAATMQRFDAAGHSSLTFFLDAHCPLLCVAVSTCDTCNLASIVAEEVVGMFIEEGHALNHFEKLAFPHQQQQTTVMQTSSSSQKPPNYKKLLSQKLRSMYRTVMIQELEQTCNSFLFCPSHNNIIHDWELCLLLPRDPSATFADILLQPHHDEEGEGEGDGKMRKGDPAFLQEILSVALRSRPQEQHKRRHHRHTPDSGGADDEQSDCERSNSLSQSGGNRKKCARRHKMASDGAAMLSNNTVQSLSSTTVSKDAESGAVMTSQQKKPLVSEAAEIIRMMLRAPPGGGLRGAIKHEDGTMACKLLRHHLCDSFVGSLEILVDAEMSFAVLLAVHPVPSPPYGSVLPSSIATSVASWSSVMFAQWKQLALFSRENKLTFLSH